MKKQQNQSDTPRLKVAVVGGGAAGMSASYYIGQRHHVDLFEASPKLGGHVQTVLAPDGDGEPIPVDMGFIVFNDRTYPHFSRFLLDLGVQSAPTDMSFSYSEPHTGFAYSGTSLSGMFARRANLIDPAFWKMIFAVLRFCKNISLDLENNRLTHGTLGRYVSANRYPDILMTRYIGPMVRAIWSAESHNPEDFPLKRFARFFSNHGLLSIRGGPTWLYIPGGSHTYVQAFEQKFSGNIITSSPVMGISPSDAGPLLKTGRESFVYDAIVLACHADTALTLLDNPDQTQTECLSPWLYVANDVVMHTDDSFLPQNTRAWACWNVIAHPQDREQRVNVHYWMNLLQRFSASKNHVVTLNPRRTVPDKAIARRLDMAHPQFTEQALNTQSRFDKIQGSGGIYYCGSYHGNGFHEDAVASGVSVARLLGAGP